MKYALAFLVGFFLLSVLYVTEPSIWWVPAFFLGVPLAGWGAGNLINPPPRY